MYLRSFVAYLRLVDTCFKDEKMYLRSFVAYLRSVDTCFKNEKMYLRSFVAYLRSLDIYFKGKIYIYVHLTRIYVRLTLCKIALKYIYVH